MCRRSRCFSPGCTTERARTILPLRDRRRSIASQAIQPALFTIRMGEHMQRETIGSGAKILLTLGLLLAPAVPADANDAPKQLAFEVVDRNAQQMTDISDALFYFGELGMQEFESTKLLKDTLTAAGFKVELGGAGMPTNLWAEYGTGRPKIAIVTEIDALPGGSQTPGTYERKPLVANGPGTWKGTTPMAASPPWPP